MCSIYMRCKVRLAMTVDTSVSFGSWQQAEQTVAGMGNVF